MEAPLSPFVKYFLVISIKETGLYIHVGGTPDEKQ